MPLKKYGEKEKESSSLLLKLTTILFFMSLRVIYKTQEELKLPRRKKYI